ncbi:MAG: hypothetical protein WCZ23_04920 [Rhodospirillaceae bacterium]
MTTLYKKPGDGAVVCGDCLSENDHLFVVELDPALFPDTYERLRCSSCGAPGKSMRPDPSPPPVRAAGTRQG